MAGNFGAIRFTEDGQIQRESGTVSGPEGTLEQVGGILNRGINDNAAKLELIFEQMQSDASNPALLARYQQIMGQYTQMISAQSSVTKAIKDAAEAVLRNA